MSTKKSVGVLSQIGLPCIVISISDVDAPPIRLAGNRISGRYAPEFCGYGAVCRRQCSRPTRKESPHLSAHGKGCADDIVSCEEGSPAAGSGSGSYARTGKMIWKLEKSELSSEQLCSA